MLRSLQALKSFSFKHLQVSPSSFFGSEIYVRNKTKNTIKKIYQKRIKLNSEQNNLSEDGVSVPENISLEDFQRNMPHPEKNQIGKKRDSVDKSMTKNENNVPEEKRVEDTITSLQNAAIIKEKQFALRILKTTTKEDVLNLYHRNIMQFKPVHLSLAFFQVVKHYKLENKLNAMKYRSSKETDKKGIQSISLWEDEKFLDLYRNLLQNIENMNPDSLVKILATIHLKKTEDDHLKVLYNQIVEWLVKDQNVLLFDRIQTIRLLATFSKLASKSFYDHPKNTQLLKLICTKLRSEIGDLRTSNIMRIYQACLRLKYSDTKLFVHLNSQARKRISYLYGNNIITCCAANITGKYEEAGTFIKTMLSHFVQKELLKHLNSKGLMNLLVLLNDIISDHNSKFFDVPFRSSCRRLVSEAVEKMIILQRKPNKIQSTMTNTQENEVISNENSLLLGNYIDKFLRCLIFLEYYQKEIILLVQDYFNKNYSLSANDLIYMLTYSLKYKSSKNEKDVERINKIVRDSIVKIEKGIIKISTETLQLLQYNLTTIFEDKQLKELAKDDSEFSSSLQLILRKFLHTSINSNYKYTWPVLLRSWNFLDKNRKIEISGRQFELLEFYIRSLQKNILQSYLIAPTEEHIEDKELVHLMMSGKDRGNIVNSLWLLSVVFSKGYPVLENAAVFHEYAQIIHQHFNWKDLTIDELDKLIEISSLFSNAIGRNPFEEALGSPEIKKVIEERLNIMYENSINRRKNIRTELETFVNEILGKENITVTKGVILPEKIVADLLIEKDGKKYVILLYTYSLENSQVKLNLLLEGSESSQPLYSPIKKRVLQYKGYEPLFVNLKDWSTLPQIPRRNLLMKFFEDTKK